MTFYSVTIQMKATEQYFPVVLFITVLKSPARVNSDKRHVPKSGDST